MKKYLFLISILSTAGVLHVNAQAPAISYSANLTFDLGAAITPVTPVNTGGAVPATYYGRVITFAGSGNTGFVNGTGTAASFSSPTRLFVDPSRNLYVADRDNGAIRKITTTGVVTTAGTGFNGPNGVVKDKYGNLFVADAANNAIDEFTVTGNLVRFAGSGGRYSQDGTGTGASFNYPFGIAIDTAGNLYVADTYNNQIRKVTPKAVDHRR